MSDTPLYLARMALDPAVIGPSPRTQTTATIDADAPLAADPLAATKTTPETATKAAPLAATETAPTDALSTRHLDALEAESIHILR